MTRYVIEGFAEWSKQCALKSTGVFSHNGDNLILVFKSLFCLSKNGL